MKRYAVAYESSACDTQMLFVDTMIDAYIQCDHFAKESGAQLSGWNKWVNMYNQTSAIIKYSHTIHSKTISIFKIR